MGPVHYHAGNFPPRDIDWKRLVPRLNPTATAVARYDGMLAAVPNPAILLSLSISTPPCRIGWPR
jgi:hypothetical protein